MLREGGMKAHKMKRSVGGRRKSVYQFDLDRCAVARDKSQMDGAVLKSNAKLE